MDAAFLAFLSFFVPMNINLEKEKVCLEQTIHGEAKGENRKGKMAIAELILNRVHSDYFPSTICGVVKDDNYGKQFKLDFNKTYDVSDETEIIAQMYIDYISIYYEKGKIINSSLTDGAIFFRNKDISDRDTDEWFNKLLITVVLGKHTFYKLKF